MGAILTLLIVGAFGGLFPFPDFLTAKMLRNKLSFLLLLQLPLLYVPAASDYAQVAIGRLLGSVVSGNSPMTARETLNGSNWFNPVTGQPHYFYAVGDAGLFYVYSRPGYCAVTGKPLEPLADEAIRNKILARAKGKVAEEETNRMLAEEARTKVIAEQQELHRTEEAARVEKQRLEDKAREDAQAKKEQEQKVMLVAEEAKRMAEQKVRDNEAKQHEHEKLLARYFDTGVVNAHGKHKVAVCFASKAAADLLERSLLPSLEALTSDKRLILPAAMNGENLAADGLWERVWNGDTSCLADFSLSRRFDMFVMLRTKEETITSSVQSTLHSVRCSVTMKVFSTNPLQYLRSCDASATVPALSRETALGNLRERLTVELAKTLAPLLP